MDIFIHSMRLDRSEEVIRENWSGMGEGGQVEEGQGDEGGRAGEAVRWL